MIHNPYFKVVEFDHFKMQAGLPNFVLSVSEWIEKTGAIGIMVKKGKYGGTYAFQDIAFEFGSAISVTFKLYLIEEFQRLKQEEQKQLGRSAKLYRIMNNKTIREIYVLTNENFPISTIFPDCSYFFRELYKITYKSHTN